MATDKGAPPSLEALFKGKAKKKVKPVNFNEAAAADKAAAPAVATGPTAFLRPAGGTAFAAAAANDEGWERSLKKDEDLLKNCGLWIKEVDADGACLFRAFADHLSPEGSHAHSHLRTQCVDFMEAHREDFEPFIDEDFSGYCSRMRQPSTWGGHVEVQALARLHGVNAIIYQPSTFPGRPEQLLRSAVEVLGSDRDDVRCVQLSFHPNHHAGQHYNSVRCSGDDGTSPAPPASLEELRRRVEDALKPQVAEVTTAEAKVIF